MLNGISKEIVTFKSSCKPKLENSVTLNKKPKGI